MGLVRRMKKRTRTVLRACVCTYVCKHAYTRVYRLCIYISSLFCTNCHYEL